MKKAIIAAFVLCATICACNNNTTPPEAGQTAEEKKRVADSTAAAGAIFPIPNYIGGQLKLVDSFQYPVTRKTLIGRNEQISLVSNDELKALAANFQHPDLNDPSLRPHYQESSFGDASIPSVTFTYNATKEGLEVRRLDVIVKPSPSQADQIRSIYMEKEFSRNDTLFSQRLFWQNNQGFQIITTRSFNKTSLPTEQLKVSLTGNQ